MTEKYSLPVAPYSPFHFGKYRLYAEDDVKIFGLIPWKWCESIGHLHNDVRWH